MINTFVSRGEQWPAVDEITDGWPELPYRIDSIFIALSSAGLAKDVHFERTKEIKETTFSAIQAVHDQQYIAFLQTAYEQATILRGGEKTLIVPEYFPHTRGRRNQTTSSEEVLSCPKNPLFASGFYAGSSEDVIGCHSFDCAFDAACCAVVGSEAVASGKIPTCYVLVRPPGHHAGPRSYGGYCFLNNAAICTHHAQQIWKSTREDHILPKVSIFDVDYHHGDGTQTIFWNNPTVQFVSIHADPNEEYPYFTGYSNETGGNLAPNSNFNIPLPLNATAEQYQEAYDIGLISIRNFKPHMLVVSLGFDSAENDPVTGGCAHNNEKDFELLGKKIKALSLPTIFVHEGGYSKPERLGSLAISFFKGFLN